MSGTELMILYQRGDIEAFNCLYDKYKSMIYGYLYKRVDKHNEVDEIFQDVFLRLHQSRLRYKSEFPFEPWLFTVLRNSLIDYYRKKKKEYANVPLDDLEVTPLALQVEEKHNLDRLLPTNTGLKKTSGRPLSFAMAKTFHLRRLLTL